MQFGSVHDSSWIDPLDPVLDGRRPVMACGSEHLHELHDAYAARPFVDEELWAGQIRREICARNGAPLHAKDLALLLGLTVEQVERTLAWHNAARSARTQWRTPS